MVQRYDSDLDRQISQNRACIASAQSENDDIDGRIDRLTRARDKVNDIYQDAKGLRRSISDYNPGGGWKGDCRKRFDGKKDAAKDAAKDYEKAVDNVYDQLKDAIRDLNDKKNDNLGIIGDCEDVVNNCVNALQKMVHSW